MADRVYTADYVEHATLQDGTPILLRLVTPDDKELLRRGFENWSYESRYTRFLVPKQRLSDEELEYLCNVDQESHFAMGAIREGEGEPRGLGIARFIRLPDKDGEPVTAEAAVAVADEIQGKGLGRILFVRLIAAAQERGIARFRCEVLGTNLSMKMLIDAVTPDHVTDVGGGVMTIDFTLPVDAPHESPMYRFLRVAAEQTQRNR
ncbi:MAG TPA: GNAT family N-acetyltransferase [Kofleriaceae bacterium]|nr:GNAT family N-acetyltransferase [Kofleriaceae bacterium]